jgi:hypothetical protein
VAAFIYASADMVVTAHGGKTAFYLTDSLDAQYIYNAARNIEIAVWMLSNRRNAAGQPLLLADEITERERNLSFEREFGKIIGRLDLLSSVLTEKYRRAVITYVQNSARRHLPAVSTRQVVSCLNQVAARNRLRRAVDVAP